MSGASTPAVRSLRFWRDADLFFLAGLLQEACTTWARAWSVRLHSQTAVTCLRADDEALAGARLLAEDAADGAAWIAMDGVLARSLSSELFGEQAVPGSVAQEVATLCGEDALLHWASALGMRRGDDGASVLPRHLTRWDGWVSARLPFSCRLLLNAAAVDAALRDRRRPAAKRDSASAPLTAVFAAASAIPLPMSVELEGCEVDLGVLQGLQRGDVLRLQHRLELPAAVRSVTGETVFSGYLARKGGRKAVELALPAVSSHQGDATP